MIILQQNLFSGKFFLYGVDNFGRFRRVKAADFIVEHTRKSQKILLELMGKPLPPAQYRLLCLDGAAAPAHSSSDR